MNRFMKLATPVSLLTLAGVAAYAADKPTDTSPPAAPSENEQESLQPEINIIQRKDKTIEEYRVNGRLYKIKVTPKVGPAYYLVDSDGDGSFETRRASSDLEPDLLIPQWVLFRW